MFTNVIYELASHTNVGLLNKMYVLNTGILICMQVYKKARDQIENQDLPFTVCQDTGKELNKSNKNLTLYVAYFLILLCILE